jgi:hypothetical protein
MDKEAAQATFHALRGEGKCVAGLDAARALILQARYVRADRALHISATAGAAEDMENEPLLSTGTICESAAIGAAQVDHIVAGRDYECAIVFPVPDPQTTRAFVSTLKITATAPTQQLPVAGADQGQALENAPIVGGMRALLAGTAEAATFAYLPAFVGTVSSGAPFLCAGLPVRGREGGCVRDPSSRGIGLSFIPYNAPSLENRQNEVVQSYHRPTILCAVWADGFESKPAQRRP